MDNNVEMFNIIDNNVFLALILRKYEFTCILHINVILDQVFLTTKITTYSMYYILLLHSNIDFTS